LLPAAGPYQQRHAEHRSGHLDTVPTPPESTKTSPRQLLITQTRECWPQLADLTIRHHGQFAYIDGQLPAWTTPRRANGRDH